MNNIKNMMSDFEGDFDPKGWPELEKRLPKQTLAQKFGKWFSIAVITSAIIIVGIIGYVIYSNLNISREKYIRENQNITANAEIQTSKIQNRNTDTNSDNIKSTYISIKSEHKTSSSSVNFQDESPDNQDVLESRSQNIQTAELIDQNTDNENNEQYSTSKTISEPEFNVFVVSNCTPSEVKFSAANLDKNYDIVWTFDTGKQAKGTDVSYTYTKKGLFTPTVSLYFNGVLEKSINLKSIQINETPKSDFSWLASGNTYLFSTERTVNLTYKWEIDNNIFDTEKPEYEFHKNGDYDIKLTLTNNAGCAYVQTKSISVNIVHLYYVPNAFTPDKDGVNSTFGPIGEKLDFKTFNFIITNVNGKTVFTSTDVRKQWNGKYNNVGEDAEQGIYRWTIKTVDNYGNSQTKKGIVNLIR